MANAGIVGIVVDEFCYKKKLYPIILLKVDKGLEVGFHCAILHFDLTIRL